MIEYFDKKSFNKAEKKEKNKLISRCKNFLASCIGEDDNMLLFNRKNLLI